MILRYGDTGLKLKRLGDSRSAGVHVGLLSDCCITVSESPPQAHWHIHLYIHYPASATRPIHFTPEMQIITHIKHSNTTRAVGYQQLISLSRDVK